eukprot:3795052-Rhodomonas_salina.2
MAGTTRLRSLLVLLLVVGFMSPCSPEVFSHANDAKLRAFAPAYPAVRLRSSSVTTEPHCERVPLVVLRYVRSSKRPAHLRSLSYYLEQRTRFPPRTSLCLHQAREQGGESNSSHPYSLPSDAVVVRMDSPLGRGSYGDVYEATVTSGQLVDVRAVAKRAVDRFSFTIEEGSAGPGTWSTQESPAAAFLQVEEEINTIVSEECPHVAAGFFGACEKDGDRWKTHYSTHPGTAWRID